MSEYMKPILCTHGKVQHWGDAGEDNWSPQYCRRCTFMLLKILLQQTYPETENVDGIVDLLLGTVEAWANLRD